MKPTPIAMLHYTAPPVVGGVEAVLYAHAQQFIQNHYPVTIITGRGETGALPPGVELRLIPEIDSQHPHINTTSQALEAGHVPAAFDEMVDRLIDALGPALHHNHTLIVHNLFTKHFNLPATAALHRLLDIGSLQHCIAWCHDFTWTSPSSRSKVHPGQPWDLLRTYRPDVTYVVVSQRRQRELAALLGCPPEQIHVVYNGVDPQPLLGLSEAGQELITRLKLLESDLVLLMPVRVTQAKNIECALRVVAALKARGCRAKLVLTGPPDPHDEKSMTYLNTLQELRKQLGVEQEMRFVFESGPDPQQPLLVDMQMVGELMRASDVVFVPSHREGFGMPVLEAGLAGAQVMCTAIPAAEEIGGADVIVFDANETPMQVAERLLTWARQNQAHRLRRRVRQNYTWQAIFEHKIKPLLKPDNEP